MPSGTTRIVDVNYAVASATVIVGTPPSEDPLYPASNLLTPDRNVKWRCPDGGVGDVTLDIGVNKTVNCFGLQGLERNTYPTSFVLRGAMTFPDPVIGALTVSTLNNQMTRSSGSFLVDKVKPGQRITGSNIQAGTTVVSVTAAAVTMSQNAASNATGTAVATFSDYQDVGTFGLGPNGDTIYVLGSPLTYRYYSFRPNFTILGGFAVGKAMLGHIVDLGIAYSPGSTETLIRQRVHNRTVGGSLLSTTTGRDRKRLSYLYRSVNASMRDVLVAAVKSAPFTIITPFNEAMEVDVPEDGLSVVNSWGPPDLFDIQLNAESLP